jgi:hypothetical protein
MRDAIDAVCDAHEQYSEAVLELERAEYDLRVALARDEVFDTECQAFIAAGPNEKAREARRIVWRDEHYSAQLARIERAEVEKAKAERELELARGRLNLLRRAADALIFVPGLEAEDLRREDIVGRLLGDRS